MLSEFATRIKQPTALTPLEIYSDGNDDYTTVLGELFNTTYVNYGQLIKVREHGRVVDKIRKVVYGNPLVDDIETVYVENYNGILRGRVSRLVRKTKGIGKRVSRLENALFLFQFYWNFIKPIHGKLTPALIEKQATKVWTWGNFLHYKLRYSN